MLRAIKMGWFILDKYYTISDQVPVYAAALLLDPSCRAAYLEKNWPKAWHEPALEAANALWDENFKTAPLVDHPVVSEPMPPPPKPQDNQLQLLMKDMEVVKPDLGIEDDFRIFVESPTFRIDCTPLQWWCRSEQRRQYPKLSRMAISILSIPAESSEPERTFSGARRSCSWDRLRLSCGNIERIECIGSWLREGHIRPLNLNGMGMPMEPEAEDDLEEIGDEDMDLVNWA